MPDPDAEAAVLAAVESCDYTKLAGIPFKDAIAAWDRLHATHPAEEDHDDRA